MYHKIDRSASPVENFCVSVAQRTHPGVPVRYTDSMADARSPTCPRCGYDLAGAIATWTDSCPMTGTCSECGLHLHWPDVINGHLHDLRWFYEHTPKGRWGLGRVVGTLLRLVFPWWFWGKVKLHHRIDGRRQVWFLVLATLPFYLLGVAAAVWLRLDHALFHNGYAARLTVWDRFAEFWGTALPGIANPWSCTRNWPDTLWGPRNWHPVIFALFFASFLVPFMLALLEPSRKLCKVRHSHLHRTMLYGFGWVPIAFLADALFVLRNSPSISHLIGPSLASNSLIKSYFINAPICVASVWFAAYWYSAINQSWQMPSGRIIWFLCMVAAAMSVVIAKTLDLTLNPVWPNPW